jgi:glycosyltransferase involved in cell wall biosynthesis
MLSVIIPTYNRGVLLAQSVGALIKQRALLSEIIIVDDGSTDGTQEIIRNLLKEHSIIKYHREDNKGHQAAKNLALRIASSDLIAIIDDDSLVCDNWAKVAVETFFRYASIDALVGPVININKSIWGRIFHVINFSKWNAIKKVQCVYDAPTCNVVYKKKSIEGIYFLEDFKNIGYRDSLFNHELRRRGGKILYNPKLFIKHYAHGEYLTLSNLKESLEKKARGFFFKGHVCHGWKGRLVKYVPILYYSTFLLFIKRTSFNFSGFLELCLLAPLIVFAQTIYISELIICWLKVWGEHARSKFSNK